MFDNVELTRDELTVAAEHDGRHSLDPAKPLDRESIPILVHLPEEGIAFFSYTWVNNKSEAGAALAFFGPALGDEQITVGFPDRKVSEDMDFSNWEIEGFRMSNDLEFGTAKVEFKNDEVELDFTFEGSHPPYAYSSHKDGCPAYCADDRIEQSGRAVGKLVLRGKTYEFDTTGHRDHSWGTRDWKAFQHYRWFQGQAGPDVSIHFWHLDALGTVSLFGYVFKDGVMAEVVDLDFDLEKFENFRQKRIVATLTDDAGRTTEIEADFYAHGTLIPSPDVTLNESAARMIVDGKEGVGWMEHAWQTDYLAHIQSIPAYNPAKGG